MIKLERFDGEKTYMFPNGAIATPAEIRSQFPAVDMFPHIFEVNGHVLQAVMELSAMRGMHNIDEQLSDEEAILEMQTIINTPQVNEPSAEDRIAAAMEYQNLLTM